MEGLCITLRGRVSSLSCEEDRWWRAVEKFGTVVEVTKTILDLETTETVKKENKKQKKK